MTPFVIVGTLMAGAAIAGLAPARLSANRMLVVDGEPTFLIGLYEHPTSDARLQEAIAAGFNLIHCPPDPAALDRVHRLKARAWVNTGYALDLSEDTAKRKAALTEMVRKLGSHPALLIWEGPDEALWNCWYGTMESLAPELQAMRDEAAANPRLRGTLELALDLYDRALWDRWETVRTQFWAEAGKRTPVPAARMDTAAQRATTMGKGFAEGCRFLRSLDPSHFIWLNHAPRNSVRAMREHNREVDMAGCDIYPFPGNLRNGHSDLHNTLPSSVGDYTDRMQAAAPGKACAMVLQGFGWGDLQQKVTEAEIELGIGRRPTLREQRFMAWNAITHGANAILYWGTAYLKEPESDESRAFWQDLLTVVREMDGLKRFIAAPDVTPRPRVKVNEHYASNDGTGVTAMLKKVGDEYRLFVVNENPYGVEFTISGLPADIGTMKIERVGNGAVRLGGGRSISDGIKGYDVHIYHIGPP